MVTAQAGELGIGQLCSHLHIPNVRVVHAVGFHRDRNFSEFDDWIGTQNETAKLGHRGLVRGRRIPQGPTRLPFIVIHNTRSSSMSWRPVDKAGAGSVRQPKDPD